MVRVLREYEDTADNPVPPVVRVAPDHGGCVLWGDKGGIEPGQVGISDELGHRLMRWYDVWQQGYVAGDRYDWPSDAERRAWEGEGAAILAALDDEFGGRIRFVGGFGAADVTS